MKPSNPLYLPLPSEPIQQVKRLARDLAWGAANGMWGVAIVVLGRGPNEYQIGFGESALDEYLAQVWNNKTIPIGLLVTFRYITHFQNSAWLISEKAFDLIDEDRPEAIFVSYRRSISSAVAMLIAAELRVEGFRPFLDIRSIALGDEWHTVLENRVRQSNIFIPVIGPTTLDSDYVKEEVVWALENETARRIIPIVHAGFSPADLDKSPFPALAKKNPIFIREDNAADFFAALQQLKAFLGA